MVDLTQVPDTNGLSSDSMRGSEHFIRHDLVAPDKIRQTDFGKDLVRDELSFHERRALELAGMTDALDSMDTRLGAETPNRPVRTEFVPQNDPLAVDRAAFMRGETPEVSPGLSETNRATVSTSGKQNNTTPNLTPVPVEEPSLPPFGASESDSQVEE